MRHKKTHAQLEGELRAMSAAASEAMATQRRLAENVKNLEIERGTILQIINDVWPASTSQYEVIEALVANHKNYVALITKDRAAAERLVKGAEELKTAIRFLERCAEHYDNGTHIGNDTMAFTLKDVFQQLRRDIDSLTIGAKGLLDGHQKLYYTDALDVLKRKNAESADDEAEDDK